MSVKKPFKPKHYAEKPSIPRYYLGAFKIGHRVTVEHLIDEELSYKLLKKILKSRLSVIPPISETASDYDKFTNQFADKKAIAELEFLTKFNNEYYSARAPKSSKPLFDTPELIKTKNDMHNARRRDITSREYNFLVNLDGSCAHTSTEDCNSKCGGTKDTLTDKERKALF